MKKTILAAALVAGTMIGGVANASILNGTFDIDIYRQVDSSNPDSAAIPANLLVGDLLGTIEYTGDLNFSTSGTTQPTIASFLATAGGSVDNTEDNIDLTGQMTESGYDITTFFDITANLTIEFDGVVSHDDGISVYDDGILVSPAASAAPTQEIDSEFAFNGGNFRLIYSAANGNPEVLLVNANNVSPVPLPAAVWLFGSALLGVFGIARRKSGKLAA